MSMIPKEVRIIGTNVLVYDTKNRRYNQAGRIVSTLDKDPYYLSFHNVILYKWSSLGVTKSILEELNVLGIKRVVFKLTINDVEFLYGCTVNEMLESDKVMNASNEMGVTMHIPIDRLTLLN